MWRTTPLGNLVGGAIFVGAAYYFAYIKVARTDSK